MKTFLSILVVLVILTVVIDVYAIFHQGIFYTPFSKVLNIGTSAILFVYLLLWSLKKRKEYNDLKKR